MAINYSCRQIPSNTIRQKLKLVPRIRLASVMGMPENDFVELVRQIEANDLFKKLCSFPEKGHKPIRFSRFPGTSFSSNLLQFKDEINQDAAGCDVEALLEDKKELQDIIKRLGQQKFEEFFLLNEEYLSPAAIAGRCGLPVETVCRINSLVDEISVRDEFSHSSTASPVALQLNYCAIARIEKDERGELFTHFLSPRFMFGKYAVDHAELEKLKSQGYFSRDEIKALDRLLDDIYLINGRRTTIYRIMQALVAKQRAFFCSGKEEDLLSYTQKELARDTGIDESLVSRALQRRSVLLPDGSERPLKLLFVSRKSLIKRHIRNILAVHAGKRLSDREIMAQLKERHGITVARRTVNAYKKLA